MNIFTLSCKPMYKYPIFNDSEYCISTVTVSAYGPVNTILKFDIKKIH